MTRWGLVSGQRARRLISFVTDPTWRAYATTYRDGRRLCRAYANGDRLRFRRLLTEQVRVEELLEAAR